MIKAQPNSLDNSQTLFPDLTPLLDIIFIVMVFLLLTANIPLKTLEVAIPQTHDAEVLNPSSKQGVAINVLATSPYWALQGKAQEDWETFTTALLDELTAHNSQYVFIASDKNASVEHMLKLLAFLQKNKISTSHIIMEKE